MASGLSIAVLVIATWGVFGLDAKILGKLVLGADNRASTSKFQATAWTYALLFALVTLLVGHLLYADFDAGWDAFLDDGLNTDYLWLLGIPSAGLVGAKAITQSKAQANPAAKPMKPAADPAAEAEPAEGERADPAATRSVVDRLLTRTRELASDDNDDDPQPALGDLQYLVFNAVAIAFFLSAFLGHVELGLPSLPDTLIALTGVSAASYLSTKAVRNAAPPVIVSVRPSRVVLGAAPRPLDVAGSGFLGATGKGDTPSRDAGRRRPARGGGRDGGAPDRNRARRRRRGGQGPGTGEAPARHPHACRAGVGADDHRPPERSCVILSARARRSRSWPGRPDR